jgi:hypothetical protein
VVVLLEFQRVVLAELPQGFQQNEVAFALVILYQVVSPLLRVVVLLEFQLMVLVELRHPSQEFQQDEGEFVVLLMELLRQVSLVVVQQVELLVSEEHLLLEAVSLDHFLQEDLQQQVLVVVVQQVEFLQSLLL